MDLATVSDRESAMSKPDLESMQFDELWAIHEELTKILSDKILAEKRELEKRLAKLNQSGSVREGADLPLAPGGRAPRRKYQKVQPKFRNPLMPSRTTVRMPCMTARPCSSVMPANKAMATRSTRCASGQAAATVIAVTAAKP